MVTIFEFIMDGYRASYAMGYGSSGTWNPGYWCQGSGTHFGDKEGKPAQYPLTRHKNGCNFLFWDGHVEFLNPTIDSNFTGKFLYNQEN